MLQDSTKFAAQRWPEGTGMIYLGMSPWEGMWKSRHQLMSRFSAQMPVLYVEPWTTLRSLRTGKVSIRAGLRRVRDEEANQLDSKVTVLSASVFHPVSQSPLLRELTQNLWLKSVRRAAIAAGIKRPILWICRPEMDFAIEKFDEQLSIYHVVDEYSGYTGLDQDAIRRIESMESNVLDIVDLTIAASPELVLAKSGRGRDIVLVENGVEPVDYADARKATRIPADIVPIPRPRIGYCGLIGKRLNLDLLAAIAHARPEWSIVMIGKVDRRQCDREITRLSNLSNVHFLGEKAPTDVARYICSLDVGLLPYAINRETRHISPIKMYEYWAAGKAVVSTAIPAAAKHDFAVNVVNSEAEFIGKIDELVNGIGSHDSQYLIELAEQNSWQNRVDFIARELKARLEPGFTSTESSSKAIRIASIDSPYDSSTTD